MYDLISRRAAIDRIRAERNKSSTPKEWRDGMDMAIFCLIYLQPESCGDAVSRNAIIQKLNEMDRYVSTELRLCDTDKKFPQNEVFIVDDVYEIIEQLPPVQPEIIYCKDCKWYGRANPRIFYRGMDCLQKRIDTIVPDKDFCSKAERREDGSTLNEQSRN